MNQLDPVVRRLREQLPALTILENEPMRAHCSFRIGGPARALAQPSSAEETAALCRILRSADVTPLIIGNGTNLLVTDAELNRIVIQMGDNMAEAGQTGPDTLQAGCGIPLARLAQTALACYKYVFTVFALAHGKGLYYSACRNRVGKSLKLIPVKNLSRLIWARNNIIGSQHKYFLFCYCVHISLTELKTSCVFYRLFTSLQAYYRL